MCDAACTQQGVQLFWKRLADLSSHAPEYRAEPVLFHKIADIMCSIPSEHCDKELLSVISALASAEMTTTANSQSSASEAAATADAATPPAAAENAPVAETCSVIAPAEAEAGAEAADAALSLSPSVSPSPAADDDSPSVVTLARLLTSWSKEVVLPDNSKAILTPTAVKRLIHFLNMYTSSIHGYAKHLSNEEATRLNLRPDVGLDIIGFDKAVPEKLLLLASPPPGMVLNYSGTVSATPHAGSLEVCDFFGVKLYLRGNTSIYADDLCPAFCVRSVVVKTEEPAQPPAQLATAKKRSRSKPKANTATADIVFPLDMETLVIDFPYSWSSGARIIQSTLQVKLYRLNLPEEFTPFAKVEGMFAPDSNPSHWFGHTST